MPDYHSEADRRDTFKTWTNTTIDTDRLARTGFFALHDGQAVRCYFCNLIIASWDPHDHIVRKHFLFSPECPLLNRHITYNQPLNAIKLNREIPPFKEALLDKTYTRLNILAELRDHRYSLSLFQQISLVSPWTRKHESLKRKYNSNYTGIQEFLKFINNRAQQTNYYALSTPKFPQFNDPIKRYQSLMEVNTHKIPPEILAMSGLFSINDEPKLTCFHCGWQATEWDQYDDTWIKHITWSPSCHFIKTAKGHEFQTRTKHHTDIVYAIQQLETPTNKTSEQKTDTSFKCKICQSNDIGAVFLPCGHATTCSTCAKILNFTTRKCPVCRDNYILYQDIYIS